MIITFSWFQRTAIYARLHNIAYRLFSNKTFSDVLGPTFSVSYRFEHFEPRDDYSSYRYRNITIQMSIVYGRHSPGLEKLEKLGFSEKSF